ncbi:CRISPR/Cas system CSM-associated protein Csm3, group 7 of RAMP superfamily [Tessaracoccus bendigoensis DSM 12906]|uniref:CRISPR/Cas system CSM-associated protein Csm3, group 7 of RAMP superfamily n=2 Tax=Tessaracoccus TaxID=72763 RepID=A0A1M6KQ75_9ACTN|nr:CRISPR/Cas system CSM-associated protein Csm3, group 7 of RAMP superfamily [Tessaracoccus bendigoensis DSM 12906]
MGMRYTTILRLEFMIDRPWAIGAFTAFGADDLGKDDSVQQPIQRRPDGAVHLPAASLVGSLRAHLGTCAARWLGSEKADSQPQGGRTSPSPLRAAGAQLLTVGSPEVSTHVRIDASRRAAAAGQLTTREYVPENTRVRWWLFWDREHIARRDLDDLLAAIEDWQPIVGRHRVADQGRARLSGIHHATIDRHDPVDLTWWLQQRGDTIANPASAPPPGGWLTHTVPQLAPEEPLLECEFEVVDPLHLGTGEVVSSDGYNNTLGSSRTLSATSWRGIFRHRVRHILEVTGADATPVVEKLFGAGREKGASEDAGFRGSLRFAASPVHGVPPELPCLTQVGIDRISGGTVMNSKERPADSHGSLFRAQYLPPGATLVLRIYGDASPGELDLLEAVVRDIDDQIVGVGGMTTRGYGSLKLTKQSLKGGAR